MHINFMGGNVQFPLNRGSWDLLTELLPANGSLLATVRRTTPHSIFLKIENRELELSLAQLDEEHRSALTPGSVVRLEVLQEQVIMTKLSHPRVQHVQSQEGPLIPSKIEEALVELNIPPTPTTIEVAQALLKGGFPLQETLLWAVIPWAKKGQLDLALLLLQARFPLTPELVKVVEELRNREGKEPILSSIGEQLSSELEEILTTPRWENRAKGSDRPQDREVVCRLGKILVEERFVEALLNRQAPQHEYVFALPFLLNGDLYTSWVRICAEQQHKEGFSADEPSFRIELEIPTNSLGLVEADLAIWGKNVSLVLWVEGVGHESLEDALPLLEEELMNQGWELSSVTILSAPREGGLTDAKSSSFTL